jgi:hypothetical protein
VRREPLDWVAHGHLALGQASVSRASNVVRAAGSRREEAGRVSRPSAESLPRELVHSRQRALGWVPAQRRPRSSVAVRNTGQAGQVAHPGETDQDLWEERPTEEH